MRQRANPKARKLGAGCFDSKFRMHAAETDTNAHTHTHKNKQAHINTQKHNQVWSSEIRACFNPKKNCNLVAGVLHRASKPGSQASQSAIHPTKQRASLFWFGNGFGDLKALNSKVSGFLNALSAFTKNAPRFAMLYGNRCVQTSRKDQAWSDGRSDADTGKNSRSGLMRNTKRANKFPLSSQTHAPNLASGLRSWWLGRFGKLDVADANEIGARKRSEKAVLGHIFCEAALRGCLH